MLREGSRGIRVQWGQLKSSQMYNITTEYSVHMSQYMQKRLRKVSAHLQLQISVIRTLHMMYNYTRAAFCTCQ